MDLLENNKVPLSAYDILDKLHDFGFRAPLQVYRALDKLIELGLVHRLETLNAFVACQHKNCESNYKKTTMFTICEMCGNVHEFVNTGLIMVNLKRVELLLNLKVSVLLVRNNSHLFKI